MKTLLEASTTFLIGTIMTAMLWVAFVADDYKWENKVDQAVVAWVKGGE